MSDATYRARSTTEIVDAAFQVVRRHYGAFLLVTAAFSVPRIFVSAILANDLLAFSQADPALGVPDIPTSLLFAYLAGWVWLTLTSAVLMVLAGQAYMGEQFSVGAAFRAVMKRLPGLLLVSLVQYILLMFGFILFIVGALYFFARFCSAQSALLFENVSAGTALRRASELSKGRKRHILNATLLVGLVYMLMSMATAAIFGFTKSFALTQLGSNLLFIALYPLVPATLMLLYYDLRIRGEAFDLELMARRLTPQHDPTAA